MQKSVLKWTHAKLNSICLIIYAILVLTESVWVYKISIKAVPKAVNREQDEEFLNALLVRARELGFQSTNLDLIYGLPLQNVESFMFTLHKVIELNPDRLSIFNYAHLPSRFAGQAKIKEDQLPAPETKLEILQKTIETLGNTGL